MKLYTLEEIKETFKAIDLEQAIGDFIKFADPIELPSDEEIEKSANTQSHYEGAMWLKYKILNQNK